jgi:ribose transport system substrate-binding protein
MKRTRYYVTLTSLLAVALFALAGCQGQESKGETPTTTKATIHDANLKEKPKIALIMKSLANEFFQNMQNGAEAHQVKNATVYSLLTNGIKDEQDIARQQQLVEQMIGQQVKAIVIAPADSKALIPICKKAIEAGIVVINIDNKFDADVLKDQKVTIPFVGPDNRKGAKEVGDFLAKQLKEGDEVAILEGIPTAFNAQQRKAGFEEAMNGAKMKVVASQSANWETDQANKVASALLTAHPNLKALLCANDSMALGAVSAVKAANKAGQVKIVGFDNITAIQQLVKQGAVVSTADQHADQLAVFGIEFALEALARKAELMDKETPVDLITATNLK